MVQELGERIGLRQACELLGVVRSTLYRRRQGREADGRMLTDSIAGRLPGETTREVRRGLSEEERAAVREVLNSPRFQDAAPREVWATLLEDDGVYLCHWRTMYRILEKEGEVRERRNQLRHPHYKKPELLANRPNQVWSWDITRLLGPVKWTYFYLYVMMDVFSRYVVGWLIAAAETAEWAEHLIRTACERQAIQPGELIIHADRGAPMKAKTVAELMADLGVSKSHSRPYVSDDNPYSEAGFKTMKYHPDYPERFETMEIARAWARPFWDWYNDEHHHTGIALLTPATVHAGKAADVLAERQAILTAAFEAHPERFPNGVPMVAPLPSAVWINPPKPAVTTEMNA